MSDDDVAAAAFRLLDARAPGVTLCPSEVARLLAGDDEADWRALMPAVRRVAAALAAHGLLRVTRGGVDVPAAEPGGPIRLGRPEP